MTGYIGTQWKGKRNADIRPKVYFKDRKKKESHAYAHRKAKEEDLLPLFRFGCWPVAEQKKNGENYVYTVQSLRKEKESAEEGV